MEFMEAIYSRRAVREFTTEPVDRNPLRQLIDAAVQAPSAVNQQPWSFFVVQQQALLARSIWWWTECNMTDRPIGEDTVVTPDDRQAQAWRGDRPARRVDQSCVAPSPLPISISQPEHGANEPGNGTNRSI